ncbi:heme utilization cystosolic carrier protein HutX [Moritella yayanosii]|uniref:Heme utilization cystosolic carrier protein HutX n=1 Tax=Moritella yayanosii TaxID=69539 RepID=A0A330LUY5_9GAMM|nr:heme utilization cystosolic carrier protein HutX [Moritella yayanosii]SQD80062.1 Heme utilization cystosolic carrier protein HutX [Moritella yayanosii]
MHKNSTRNAIHQLMTDKPRLRSIEVALELNCSELEVIQTLPEQEVNMLPVEHAQGLLTDIADWGKVTCIIEVSGFVFEVKAPFPKGKNAYGYYNLLHDSDGLQGHLKLDNLSVIALLTRKVRGKLSYYVQFFDHKGNSVFKIYLGRDKNGEVNPEQIARFNALSTQTVCNETIAIVTN